jgi:hypothetical protein
MVKIKRGIAVKSGLTLLAVMLFFTFFSGTINSFLTPKVTISLTRQGFIMPEDDSNMIMGILIPLSAVIDGSFVYVVHQTDTFLGRQLRVEYRFIEIGGDNGFQAVVTDGLSTSEYIVTSWDRPLRDGLRVMLPHE